MTPPQDVVELILGDHRTMEDLLRLMRSVEADRQAALQEFAHLMIAHGEAEESTVYPLLAQYEDTDTVEHIEAEHREAARVLLALLEVPEVGSAEWDWRLKQLAAVTARHFDEEERSLLNTACETLTHHCREELTAGYVTARGELLRAGCGAVDNVRRMVQAGAPV
ncbi:hemerythrin domain-containing protein [Streptomyces sp. NPDC006393]|uniref:hemerythrin domain-containing protein n=1 Tax=Streptomyces sp. NPDC006393 TaxID=3156763 RepID=UPI0033F170FE